MLSLDYLHTLSNKYQTTELNVRREYIQHLFLSYFYQQQMSNSLLFKGGTALRIVYGSPRFSEDLDFNATISNITTIENVILRTLREIEREGIKTELEEAKETTGGYLTSVSFQLEKETLPLQLEISLRDITKRSELTTIAGNFVPPYPITLLVREKLIEEKMMALLTRQKPRDFYDLYFALRANLLSDKDKKLLPEAYSLLQKSDILFDRELKIFLPKSHWQIIKDFKKTLGREIEKFL